MARRDSIAFHGSHNAQLWRRFSEPSATHRVSDHQIVPGATGQTPKPYRRFSFSALDEYRSGKHVQINGTSPNHSDLSAAGVRNQVDHVLAENGFKQAQNAKVTQLRRYSQSVDKDVVNPLGCGVRRGSFGAVAADKGDHQTNKTKTSQNKPKLNKSRQSDPVGPSIPRNPVRRDAWVESVDYPSHTTQPEVKNPEGDRPGGYVDQAKTVSLEDLDDHLRLKKSLWSGRCRRDSLAKFRNRVVDALRFYPETDTEYWRRCRSIDTDHSSSMFPKCKYRLRENGLIASELANLSRVDIDDTGNRLKLFESSDSPRDSSVAQRSLGQAAPDNAEILRSLIKKRRRSSLFSEYESESKVSLHRSLSSFSDRNSCSESPELGPWPGFILERCSSLQETSVSNPQYMRSLSYPARSLSTSPTTRDRDPENSRARLRGSSTNRRRWSQTPSPGFELIGTAALHGTPGYKGRLMLLTARTVRFDDEFKST